MSIYAVSEHGNIAQYANSYSGYTRIARLIFIASRIRSPQLEQDALKMALDQSKKDCNAKLERDALKMAFNQSKKDCNTKLYRRAAELADGRFGSSCAPDEEWVQKIEQQAAQREQKLESELENFKNLGSEKDIQVAYENLGNFYYEQGDLLQAAKNYALAHGFCDTAELLLHIYLKVIVASVQTGAFEELELAYIAVKSAEEEGVANPVMLAKWQVAAGLSTLGLQEYKHAAEHFVGVSFELQNNFSEVVSPEDVAIYGGLCALYSFDREELKSKVIDNVSFNHFLELVPEIREPVYDYYFCRFGSCLQFLQQLKSSLLLDIYLHNHVERLYVQIRQKAMIQYTIPFDTLDLKLMAILFKTSTFRLEEELAGLIREGKIKVTNLRAKV